MTRVGYWEGTKFAAKIRSMKTDINTVLVKINMGSGHGGSSGRYDRLKEVAFDYAYIFDAARDSSVKIILKYYNDYRN